MKISTLKHFLVDALKSIKRNRTISIAAAITVLITFFIFGTFTLLGLNFNKVIDSTASKIEIRVNLKDNITLVEQREIEIKLNEEDGVKEVKFQSKDESFLEFKERLKDTPGLLQGYDLQNNPLQDLFIVKLKDPQYAQEVGEAIKDMPGVDDIKGQQQLIEKISLVVNGVKVIGIALFAVFICVSIFLITNTIKITVYSRRREVGIMKYVGATDWFIRWPFIIEGIIIGATGSLLSSVALYFSYKFVYGMVISNMLFTTLVPPTFVLSSLMWMFGLGGVAIGAIGSATALRKFLHV